MEFEQWWAKQTANFDPEEIGLMQLARVTWHASQDVNREACASMLDDEAARLDKLGVYMEDVAHLKKMAAKMRSNVEGKGLAATHPTKEMT